ncbi:MAG: hypothetical protein AAF645_30690 [Myxococcota bacterium]
MVEAGLLGEFLVEEASAWVLDEVRRLLALPRREVSTINFNRFEVTIDHVKRIVILEDIVSFSEEPQHESSIDEFVGALERTLRSKRQ